MTTNGIQKKTGYKRPSLGESAKNGAFLRKNGQELQASWHPSTVPGELELSNVKWLGLEVRRSEVAADTGMVEFVARWRAGGRAQRLHESSRFVREGGRWYYLDGQLHETG